MTENFKLNKGTCLNLFPICELDNSVHVQFHTANSSLRFDANVENRRNLKAYLVLRDGEVLFLQDAEHGARNAVVLAHGCFDKSVEICVNSWKQFKLAGIDVFWSILDSRQLELTFCVNTNNIIQNIESFDEVIKKMLKNNVASTINEFFANKTSELCKNYTSSNGVQPFFEELAKTTSKWEVLENYEIREELLNCQLMEYQKKTVKWMMEKEMRPEKIDLTPVLRSVKLVSPTSSNNNQSLFYYPVLGLFTKTDMFHSISAPRGGILADEMGLGKTVEVLSLIVSHRKDEQVQKSTKRGKRSSSKKQLDWEEYEAAKNVTPEEPRSCRKCEGLCEDADVEFWCSQCMATRSPLEVKTTLIVLPESLMIQWYNEIIKHCSEDLKIMFYFGLNKNGYLHPLEIAKFDIILTSYSTLSSELSFANDSTTSLTHVKWWRLVCDEAQLVEDASNRAAQMCTKIESLHRWCMTSTPIVRSIADLGGLFRIIGLWPFNVEQFWKNHVVAEFLDISEKKKNLSNSLLLQIATQVMRRNTKKMVEDQLQLPKLVEIEKVVKFTKFEESQYRKEMEGLRSSVRNVIGKMGDETLLRSIPRKGKALQALGKLKETLISCGEHSNLSKSQNANEKVISDSKNVTIRLICAKKNHINEQLRRAICVTCNVAELHWIRNEMVQVVECYDKVTEIFYMINEVNDHFEKVMKRGEVKGRKGLNIWPWIEETFTKFFSRKRPIEDKEEEVLPRKIAKLDVEEKDEVILKAEENAEKTMVEIRKLAKRPIYVECLSYVRFASRFKALENFKEIKKNVSTLKEKMGGITFIHGTMLRMIEQYTKFEKNQVNKIKDEQIKLFEQWRKNANQHVPMERILKRIEKSYKSKDSNEFLIEKLISSDKTATILRDMPFWPIFANSVKHFEDGVVEPHPATFDRYHIDMDCMGICNKKRVEEISRDYEFSTSSEVAQKLGEYIDNLETLREELFKNYSTLIDTFVTDTLTFTKQATMYCNNEKKFKVMCIDEKTRKDEQRNLPCQICSVRHTLAHLRFAIGTGSYHGIVKHSSRKPIDSFFSLVFTIEAKRDAQFDGAKQLSEFQEYLKRLRETAEQIESSFDPLIKYSRLLRSIDMAKYRKTMSTLRKLAANDATKKTWSDDQLTKYCVKDAQSVCNTENMKLTSACQELRYLSNLYEKQQNSKSSEEENCCPICDLQLEIIANYPCGHKTCENCYRELQRITNSNIGQSCVTCRRTFKHGDVILERKNVPGNSDVIPGMMLSVKLEATIRLMKEIIEEDSGKNKILLFTTMEFGTPIWKFLTKVLQKAKLPLTEVTRNDYAKNLSEFQSSTEPKILLISLPMCTNGLNLTQANHIIILDPPHSFSVVEQAIGKMHRVGQKREMKVYHMVTEGSVDEEIRKVVKSGEEGLTVGQLCQIFEITG